MLQRLQGAHHGAMVFVSYVAGRPASPTAIAQAQRARRAGISRRHFTGALVNVGMNRKGQVYVTFLVNERDGANGKGPAYRSFNPSLGNLVSMDVIG